MLAGNSRKPLCVSSGAKPGGGLEAGESPEQAASPRVAGKEIRPLGVVDHTWFWKGREVRERGWLFLASPADDPRLSRGECPELLEADGRRARTQWRSIAVGGEALPPLCPSALCGLLSSFQP
jgi:hypothetical protein